MRFTHRPRCEYTVTDRKRAAVVRLHKRQRDHLPLLGSLIAETQPGVEEVMTERVATWIRCEQAERDRRAASWRRARRLLDAHEPVTRRSLLTYWNGHRWLPGDAAYLLDMLHGFAKGRLVMRDGRVCADRIVIPVSEAVAAFGRPKLVALGWFGSRPP